MLLKAVGAQASPPQKPSMPPGRQCPLTPGPRGLALGKAGKTRKNILKRHLAVSLGPD